MKSKSAPVAALHVLAFFSGLAALVYEVVWTRRLTFVFGASIHAVSAVLAAYMAGLAFGSLAAGRKPDRPREPLLAYGLLEASVGVAALIVPVAIARLRVVDSALYDPNVARGWLTAFRFVLAFVVIGLPAALMGATFPFLARAAVGTRTGVGARVAAIYGANTAGAVAGTFLAGFFLIGELGVTGTERAAAMVNIAVAIAAIAGRRWLTSVRDVDTSDVTEATIPPVLSNELLVASVFVTGAASLACEVLWSRALAFTFSWLNNTTYAFPAMLGMMLAGIGIGSAVIAPRLSLTADPARLYGVLVTVAGVAVALSAAFMSAHGSAPFGRALDDAGNVRIAHALANIVFEAGVLVGLPALLFGAAFPAAVRVATSAPDRTGPVVARLYAASTAGAIAGSILAAFVIIRIAGIVRGVLATGVLLAATGIVVLVRASSVDRRVTVRIALAALGVIALVQWRLPARALLRVDDAPVVFYEEGPTATVTVARAADGFRRIDVDGTPVAGTSPTMLTDQKSLAHFPMMLARDPHRALTVGFGSGGTSHSYLLHSRLEHVDAVEIAPEMLHGAPFLTASNHGVLTRGDPRYRVVLDDARSYLAHTRNTYDIIATDCTDLRYRSNANLYDLEYFQFTRARLAPGGIVAVWLPLGGLSRAMFDVALRTFGEVFPDFVVFWPDGYPSHYVVLVGWRDRREVRWDRMVERLSSRAVQDDMREIGLADPVKVLSTFVADGRSLRDALRNAPINTEDHPVLEFVAPLSGYSTHASLDNLQFLVDHRVPASTLLADAMPADAAARLARFETALPSVVNGHASIFDGDDARAMRWYLDALAIAPDDVAVRDRILDATPVLAEHMDDPWNLLLLCRAEQLTGDPMRARACYRTLPNAPDEDFAGLARRWRTEFDERP